MTVEINKLSWKKKKSLKKRNENCKKYNTNVKLTVKTGKKVIIYSEIAWIDSN
jgi:hypothetical protein